MKNESRETPVRAPRVMFAPNARVCASMPRASLVSVSALTRVSDARLREEGRSLGCAGFVFRRLGVTLRPAVEFEQRETRELVLQPPVRGLARAAAVPYAPAARAPPKLVPARLHAPAQGV